MPSVGNMKPPQSAGNAWALRSVRKPPIGAKRGKRCNQFYAWENVRPAPSAGKHLTGSDWLKILEKNVSIDWSVVKVFKPITSSPLPAFIFHPLRQTFICSLNYGCRVCRSITMCTTWQKTNQQQMSPCSLLGWDCCCTGLASHIPGRSLK